jgi:hypothetical protein
MLLNLVYFLAVTMSRFPRVRRGPSSSSMGKKKGRQARMRALWPKINTSDLSNIRPNRTIVDPDEAAAEAIGAVATATALPIPPVLLRSYKVRVHGQAQIRDYLQSTNPLHSSPFHLAKAVHQDKEFHRKFRRSRFRPPHAAAQVPPTLR